MSVVISHSFELESCYAIIRGEYSRISRKDLSLLHDGYTQLMTLAIKALPERGHQKHWKKIWYALKMLLYDIYLLFLFRLKCFISFWWEQVIQFAVNKGIKYYTLYIDVEKWRKRFSFDGLETKSVLKKMRNSDASPLTL